MPTAKSTHEVLIGMVALVAFVMIAVVVTGMSKNAGDAMVALFVAFVILQLLFKANVFQSFLSAHPVVKGAGTTPAPSNGFLIPGSTGQLA